LASGKKDKKKSGSQKVARGEKDTRRVCGVRRGFVGGFGCVGVSAAMAVVFGVAKAR
jgi:hypothetical protein